MLLEFRNGNRILDRNNRVADDDEMVELTIIDDDGKPLINTLIKPKFHRTWAGAQRVHGISPLDVDNAPTQDEISDDIP